MKKLLLAFVMLLGLGLSAQAQRYVGTFVGNGNGLTNIPPTTGLLGWPANASGYLLNNGAGVLSWGSSTLPATVVTNNGTLNTGYFLVGDGGRGTYPTNAIPAGALPATVVTNNGTLTLGLPIVGDGGRGGYPSNALTLSSATITTGVIGQAYGDGNGLTNILGAGLIWKTNAVADISAIDVSGAKPYGGIATNNSFAITALSGVNTGASDTNVQWAVRVYTNTAGSTKTITIPASWICADGTTLYNTNQGALSVMRYPGFGTNAVWRPLK